MFGGTNFNKDVSALNRGPPDILVWPCYCMLPVTLGRIYPPARLTLSCVTSGMPGTEFACSCEMAVSAENMYNSTLFWNWVVSHLYMLYPYKKVSSSGVFAEVATPGKLLAHLPNGHQLAPMYSEPADSLEGTQLL